MCESVDTRLSIAIPAFQHPHIIKSPPESLGTRLGPTIQKARHWPTSLFSFLFIVVFVAILWLNQLLRWRVPFRPRNMNIVKTCGDNNYNHSTM